MDTITKKTSLASMSNGNGAFYVYYPDRLEANVKSMDHAFRSRYSNFQIAYSFKTNYLYPVIRRLSSYGCFAEVVSPYELAYAMKFRSFKGDRVIYNGVIPDADKFNVAREGGFVNVDNIEEYHSIAKIAKDNDTIIPIGVRVNFDVGNDLVSRFGVSTDDDEFGKLMKEMAENSYTIFSGFHCHIGTARPVVYWERKAKVMAELAERYCASYVDLGGGMYGPMVDELSSQFNGYAGSFDLYADAVCSVMKKAFPTERVKLIVEPGTALVGNTMDLFAHVTNIKDVRGKCYITVDTCSNHLGMICECRTIPVTNLHDSRKPYSRRIVKDACIVGCTCLEFDYIRKGYDDEAMIGDTLVFENVGAYSISAARQFIVPRIPVYDAKTGEAIRPGENAASMFALYSPAI